MIVTLRSTFIPCYTEPILIVDLFAFKFKIALVRRGRTQITVIVTLSWRTATRKEINITLEIKVTSWTACHEGQRLCSWNEERKKVTIQSPWDAKAIGIIPNYCTVRYIFLRYVFRTRGRNKQESLWPSQNSKVTKPFPTAELYPIACVEKVEIKKKSK